MRDYVWYSKNAPLDSPDTVHQVLVFGTIEDIREMKNKIGEERVRQIFENYPTKRYTPAAFNFIKNYILNIKEPLEPELYLKNTPRNPR